MSYELQVGEERNADGDGKNDVYSCTHERLHNCFFLDIYGDD